MFKKRTRLSNGKDAKRRKVEVEVKDEEKQTSVILSGVEGESDKSDDDDEIDIVVKPKTMLVSKDDSEDDSEDEDEEGDRDSTITTFLNKRKPVGSSGQIKQSKNLHSTVLIDYQPDICKDYAKTGYCGYGDNCKFLHSREDFKSGWKINKDWIQDDEAGMKVEMIEKIEKETKDIPFKCVICEEDYVNPVVTRCGHYFCRQCYFQRIKETGDNKCVICGENTHGTAKVASKLQRLLLLQGK